MIEVVAAIIFIEDKILCLKRGYSKYDYVSFKYEFPGGKVKDNESYVDALIREIQEELSIDIIIQKKFKTITHSYSDFIVKLHSYVCKTKDFNGELYEHTDYKLLKINDLKSLNWLEADLPLIDDIITEYGD
ncbi:MAG: CTP pyrophosphohydrolase [Alphaproteobacteria bacterium MarineAlpha9_Bin3]|nr:MAG: CTP pyrophosphohydrolase [Alphaproteobacteria bacterium MarineAlpha9_Bin3]